MKELLVFILFLCLTGCSSNPEEVKDLPRQKVEISTPQGTIVIALFNETPKHRDNFLKLVNEGFYEDLLFHRVQPNFMIQGGNPKSKPSPPMDTLFGLEDVGYTIPAEIDSSFVLYQGALCAFRDGHSSNTAKVSSGSQFFIVHGHSIQSNQFEEFEAKNGYKYTNDQRDAYLKLGGLPDLDGKYTIFGQVEEGMEVIGKIATLPTGRRQRPLEDVPMKIKVLEEKN